MTFPESSPNTPTLATQDVQPSPIPDTPTTAAIVPPDTVETARSATLNLPTEIRQYGK